MTDSTAHIKWVRDNRGLDAAFAEACNTVRRQAEEVEAWWQSRFYERRVLANGVKKIWPTTEGHISRAYDLQDVDGEPVPEFLYCDDDGELYPVSVGRRQQMNSDEEAPFVFAASDMVANGKVVGHVLYTDH